MNYCKAIFERYKDKVKYWLTFNEINCGTMPMGAILELSLIHICTGVEDALDVTMAQRSELDYLIYNDPLSYADLILNGDPEEYLKNAAGSHGLED